MFKLVNGWESWLEVNETGEIRKPTNKKQRYCRINLAGYLEVKVTVDKKVHYLPIHRLIAMTWHPQESYEGLVVNHKDGNKLNNHIDNLEWCTQKINVEHAVNNNLYSERHGKHVLTEEDVLQIRKEFIPESRTYGVRALATRYGVGRTTIHNVVHRKTWRHI